MLLSPGNEKANSQKRQNGKPKFTMERQHAVASIGCQHQSFRLLWGAVKLPPVGGAFKPASEPAVLLRT